MPAGDGGVGIMLGRLNDERAIGGIDLDTCRSAEGEIEPWAREIIVRLSSYTEVSPSLTGAKILFTYTPADLTVLRDRMGGNDWGKSFKRPGQEHPPAIELHLGNRYFATTATPLDDVPEVLRHVSLDDLLWVIGEAGPAFAKAGVATQPHDLPGAGSSPAITSERIAQLCLQHPALARLWSGDFSRLLDQSRSARAMAIGAVLKRAGCGFDEMCDALRTHPATTDWVEEKGDAAGSRELRRIWDKADVPPESSELREPSLAVLHRTTLPTPTLPIAAFGPFWADWITRAAVGANAPLDYTAMPLLAVASALVGNARWVTAWTGWSEPPVLWLAGVGDPSSGKTPGALPVTGETLRRVESWMARDFPTVHDEWLAKGAAADARKEVWEQEVAAAVEADRPPPELPPDLAVGDEPIRPIARVADITVEHLAYIAARQPRGLLCNNDELALWFASFQRYTGNSSNRPFWLQAYTGGFFRYDRVSRSTQVVPRLSVAIYGTIQPDRLANVLKGVDDGLVGRFLWSWPASMPFSRPTHGADIQTATDALCRLADLSMTADDDQALQPVFIRLTDEAADLFENFVRRLSEQEAQSHAFMKGAIGKARGQTLRLAIVLEYLWWAGSNLSEPVAIQKRVIEAAIGLMDHYFLPMAARIFSDAAVPADEKNARTLARWIVDTRPETINVTEIRDRARLPGLRETNDVKAGCRFLVEAHWLLEPQLTGQPGRPPGNFRVNPRLWSVLAEAEAQE
jgi:hypothetical protein